MSENKQSFKQKMQQLEEIVAWFENGDNDLEQSLAKFEEGMKLAEELKHLLARVENKIDRIKLNFDV